MHVRVNFGQQPFMYDIDGMVKVGFLKYDVDSQLTACRRKSTLF